MNYIWNNDRLCRYVRVQLRMKLYGKSFACIALFLPVLHHVISDFDYTREAHILSSLFRGAWSLLTWKLVRVCLACLPAFI